MDIFTFRVRCPLRPGASTFIWIRQQAFGLDEEDAAREIIERLPDAQELQPAPTSETNRCLCDHHKQAEPAWEHRSWCIYCGQDWGKHPIMSDAPEAREAQEWIDTLTRENITF